MKDLSTSLEMTTCDSELPLCYLRINFLHLFSVVNYATVVDGLFNKCSTLSFHRG